MTTPVNPDQLRISIEMGDDYQPSDRLGAALGELVATLADEESGAEVAGFDLANLGGHAFTSLTYDSIGPVGAKGNVFPKVESNVYPKVEGTKSVFKF